jgi:hypothetical protein
MKENDLIKARDEITEKLEWEAPKLFCLDKGKTEGGGSSALTETTDLQSAPAS